ncbi:MAG: hypothetical protein DRI90_10415 [Deltaproteobacteria bacterium]|nr:MAG: hypothetical protein DRI90_10415 [Deltaproteobacteria bacterium]
MRAEADASVGEEDRSAPALAVEEVVPRRFVEQRFPRFELKGGGRFECPGERPDGADHQRRESSAAEDANAGQEGEVGNRIAPLRDRAGHDQRERATGANEPADREGPAGHDEQEGADADLWREPPRGVTHRSQQCEDAPNEQQDP